MQESKQGTRQESTHSMSARGETGGQEISLGTVTQTYTQGLAATAGDIIDQPAPQKSTEVQSKQAMLATYS